MASLALLCSIYACSSVVFVRLMYDNVLAKWHHVIMRLYSYISGGQAVLESIFDTGHVANIVSATLGQWSKNRGPLPRNVHRGGLAPCKP